MGTLTPHLVTRDPAAAAAWYGEVLSAIEEEHERTGDVGGKGIGYPIGAGSAWIPR